MESNELESYEYLAKKSNERLDNQSVTLRNNHIKATTIVAALAIFTPLYFDLIQQFDSIIKTVSIIPIFSITISLTFSLLTLLPKKIAYGFKTEKYSKLVNKNYKDILLNEIGTNNKAFEKNVEIIKKQSSNLRIGLILCIVSIFSALIILCINFYN